MVYESGTMKSRKCSMLRVSWVVVYGLLMSDSALGDEPILLTNRPQVHMQGSGDTDRAIRYYENAIVESPMVDNDTLNSLSIDIELFLQSGGRLVDFASGRALELADLDWTQKYGVYTVLQVQSKHAEVDLRLSHQTKGARIVSAAVEPNDVIQVSHSRSWSPTYGHVSRSVIQEHYRLKAIRNGNAQWTSEELAVLADTLTFLTPSEKKFLQGVSFVREHKSQRGLAASYRFQSRHNRIHQRIDVYDLTFRGQNMGFVGGIANPKSVAHLVILHEIAHLICNQPTASKISKLNQLMNEHNRLVSQFNQHNTPVLRERIEMLAREIEQVQSTIDRLGDGPIVEAYKANRTSRRGPTRYSDQSIEEAFAESYAMFKLDPLALKRTDLGAYRWFQSGAYLELLPSD